MTKYYCNICEMKITKKEYEDSIRDFDLPLCKGHQEDFKATLKIVNGKIPLNVLKDCKHIS